MQTKVELCPNCYTMKHLFTNGLCGRCNTLAKMRQTILEEVLQAIADMEKAHETTGRAASKGDIKKWLMFELEGYHTDDTAS